MDGYKTYTVTSLKGTLGDYETEWWTVDDWERHRKYVEELKASGEYLQPQTVNLTIKENPLFDYPKTEVESYEYVLLDLSK